MGTKLGSMRESTGRARHPALPAASVSAGTAPSRPCETSAITTAEYEEFEQAAPIQFAFLFTFSVPRSEHPRPADARSPSRDSSLSGVDSSPEASSCPLPQISSTRLGSGPRRNTLRASMCRIQRTNFKKGATNHVQQSHPHRPSRKECRSQK